MGEEPANDDPLELALRALRHRDRSRAALERRLEGRGVEEEQRRVSLARLQELGYVDDVRFAAGRAAGLAARGAGNTAIEADLTSQGVAPEVAAAAIAALEPEAARATAIAARRGASAKTLRYLASRGFSDDSLEALVAEVERLGVG